MNSQLDAILKLVHHITMQMDVDGTIGLHAWRTEGFIIGMVTGYTIDEVLYNAYQKFVLDQDV